MSGSLPVGAVDAQPGTLLYEFAKRQAGAKHQASGMPAKRTTLPQDASKQAEAGQVHRQSVYERLMAKAIPGQYAPAPGMIPFGDMPTDIRRSAKVPIAGWDPADLDPEESAMANQLRMHGRQEVLQRQAAQAAAAGQPVASAPVEPPR